MRLRLEDPAPAVLHPRRLRGRVVEDLDTLATIEWRDELERAGGGKWRQSERLLPGEEVIKDARLS